MLTHLHVNGDVYQPPSSYTDLLYGWGIHIILELEGLLPGESAQVKISGKLKAVARSIIYVGVCPLLMNL